MTSSKPLEFLAEGCNALMVVLGTACHNRNRSDTLLSIQLEVQVLPGLAITREPTGMLLVHRIRLHFLKDFLLINIVAEHA